jgi:PTH1 family peptidyl-tRNA hydrolase
VENLRLIVGLGNPGRKYTRTRHNAGFLLTERLAERWRSRWETEKRFECRLARAEYGGLPLLLCQPQTFMNDSGKAVGGLAGYYQVPAGRILVVVDDADLPVGTLRLRPNGSSGGHHGLESVEQCLSSRAYPRMRIGIGREPAAGTREITNHVLGEFSTSEQTLIERVFERAVSQVECWLDTSVQKAMNQFNGVVAPSEPEKETK